MKKILIFYDYFDPAYKAGGPTRSLKNLVNFMDPYFHFYIVTTNQDHDGTQLDVKSDQWEPYLENSKVIYLSKKNRSVGTVRKIVRELDPEVLYINGIFSFLCVIYPLMVKRKIPVVIAPRGMLKNEALAIKSLKKKIYLYFLKNLFLNDGTRWQVTGQMEEQDLKAFNGLGCHFRVNNIPTQYSFVKRKSRNSPIVFGTLGLIGPMKNVHCVLEALNEIDKKIIYKIAGPVKDNEYWKKCKVMIDNLPDNINVIYKGDINPFFVEDYLSTLDYYIQPSRSENFGHSIFEAMSLGIPVIISDNTPWQRLDIKRAGWNIVTPSGQSILEAIKNAIDQSNEEWIEYRTGARKVTENFMEKLDLRSAYAKLFSFDTN